MPLDVNHSSTDALTADPPAELASDHRTRTRATVEAHLPRTMALFTKIADRAAPLIAQINRRLGLTAPSLLTTLDERTKPGLRADLSRAVLGARGASNLAGFGRSLTARSRRLFGDIFHEGPLWARARQLTGFRSLAWRIFVANMLGLGVMLGGIVYLSMNQTWLIDAKRESLQAQGEIIAQAIANTVTRDRGRNFPDPDKLLEFGSADAIGYLPYEFDNLEYAIAPEKVAPLLHPMTEKSGARARVFSRDGSLIHDTRTRARVKQPRDSAGDNGSSAALKTFWTKLDSIFVPSGLPVYKEIETNKGTAYNEVRQALTGTTAAMLLIDDRGQHLVATVVPIQNTKGILGALVLSTRGGEIDGIMRKERHIISWVSAFAILATALSSFLLAGTIAGPMRRLAATALKVKTNIMRREELPTFPDRKDEIGRMALAFRDMTAALYRRIELSEKFAADVAHELKNPVTAVRSATESLTYVTSDSDRRELVQNIQSDLRRLDKLITDISNFSRLDAELSLHQAESVDLAEVVSGVAQTLNDINAAKRGSRPVIVAIMKTGPTQSADATDEYVIQGHAGRLSQVVTNLLDNAISFSPPGGQVWARVRHVGAEIEVAVEDEGPGIPPERVEKIFERFYTDRPDSEATMGKNSGLGLAISQEIVEAHEGRIWAEQRGAGGDNGASILPGARFVVRLPAGASAPWQPPARGKHPGSAGRAPVGQATSSATLVHPDHGT